VVYGSIATPFKPDNRPSTLPPDHTHKWTVMVKGPRDSDITHFVKKVQFKLHETYVNPVRTIESPPFQVTETGWGEFEIHIKIYFVNEAAEKPCSIFHFLTLHPYGPDAEEHRALYKPVTSMNYDELNFPEPTEAMFHILTTKGGALLPNNKGSELDPFSREVEQQELDRLGLKIAEVQKVLEEKRAKIEEREREIKEIKELRAKKEEEREKAKKMEEEEEEE
ncbi:yeats family-domain-containing protein, partial [Tirmania nivea]